MTKEELDKEAEEYSRKNSGYIRVELTQAYLAGAEPREKHIAELKKQLDLKEKALSKAKKEFKRIADKINKDRRRLIRRKTELEAQIEKMKQELDTAREEANRQENWELYSVLNDIYNDNFEVITSVSN